VPVGTDFLIICFWKKRLPDTDTGQMGYATRIANSCYLDALNVWKRKDEMREGFQKMPEMLVSLIFYCDIRITK